MATKIKPTPTLTGKDAERFEKKARESEAGLYNISKEEYARMLRNYNKLNESFENIG